MLRKTIVLPLLTSLSISFGAFAGGPWASPKFGGYFELASTFTILSTVTDNTHQLYTEFGLTKRLSFKGVLPFKQISSPSDVASNSMGLVETARLSGLSNITLGLKYQLPVEAFPVSIGLDVALNTFEKVAEDGLRTGYEAYTFRPIFAIGGTKGPKYYYAEIMPGFSTNNYSTDLTVVFEYGGKIGPNAYCAFYLQARIPFSDGSFGETDAPAFEFTGYYIDRQGYGVLGPKFSIGLGKGWGLSPALFYVRGRAQASSVLSAKMGLYYQLPGRKE